MTITDIITAKHWLPNTKEVWDKNGDLRERIRRKLFPFTNGYLAPLVIKSAVVMDPEVPSPVKIIGSNWIHADVHGILTEETFFEDLDKCIVEFADMIVEEQDPFQPVRIYKDVQSAYSVGFFDWRGDEYPFDIRALCQFGKWEFQSDKKETIVSAGLRFWIGTLVLPTKLDVDIHVGRDMAKAYDERIGS